MRYSRASLIWIPRTAAIAFALFLMVFSLDVFSMEGSLLEKIGGFVIHSLSSLGMIAVLAFTWNKPFWAGLTFLALGALFTLQYRTFQSAGQFMLISLPAFVVGVLFLVVRGPQSKRGR